MAALKHSHTLTWTLWPLSFDIWPFAAMFGPDLRHALCLQIYGLLQPRSYLHISAHTLSSDLWPVAARICGYVCVRDVGLVLDADAWQGLAYLTSGATAKMWM